jgi:hypothetical protein
VRCAGRGIWGIVTDEALAQLVLFFLKLFVFAILDVC